MTGRKKSVSRQKTGGRKKSDVKPTPPLKKTSGTKKLDVMNDISRLMTAGKTVAIIQSSNEIARRFQVLDKSAREDIADEIATRLIRQERRLQRMDKDAPWGGRSLEIKRTEHLRYLSVLTRDWDKIVKKMSALDPSVSDELYPIAVAFGDSKQFEFGVRNLSYTSDIPLSADEFEDHAAVLVGGSYNYFDDQVAQDLAFAFPKAKFYIHRHSSVAVTVKGEGVDALKWERETMVANRTDIPRPFRSDGVDAVTKSEIYLGWG